MASALSARVNIAGVRALPTKAASARAMRGVAPMAPKRRMVTRIYAGEEPDWAKDESMKPVYQLMTGSDVKLPEEYTSNEYVKTFLSSFGWTKVAETVNGRLAMLGATAGVLSIFNDDLLEQIAKAPLSVLAVVGIFTAASLVPVAKPEGYLPADIKKNIDKYYAESGAPKVFTAQLEQAHGRTAMSGVAALLVLSVLFPY